MTASQLPKSGLIKQDFKDKHWESPLNQGFDTWESRIGISSPVSPVGIAQGFYIGQTFYDSARGELYYCIVPGSAATTQWKKVALEDSFNNYGNYVPLPNGGIVTPLQHQKVLGYESNTSGSWTMASGGYQAGWRVRIKCWNVVGGNLVIIGAPGAPLVSMGARLTSLALSFGDEGELYTPDGTTFIWSGTRHFTSSLFPLNAGTSFDFSHNLGANPQRVVLRLNCVVADLGYVPGDVVHINTDTQAANYGCILKATQTQVSAKLAVAGVQLMTWDTGITQPAVLDNWNGSIRADIVN